MALDANNLHFCYLAPGIVDALTATLEKQIAARPDHVASTIYFAGMGDWYGGQCQCECSEGRVTYAVRRRTIGRQPCTRLTGNRSWWAGAC